jgi:molybdenum cofactor cytidylyltransferase
VVAKRGRAHRSARFSVGVVILAAGASARMGEAKLLLPWGGTTVLGQIVKQWRSLQAAQIAAVIRKGHQTVELELRRLGVDTADWIVNDQAQAGMFSSIQAAARWDGWRAELTHFVVALGDQPQIRRETLQDLIRFADANAGSICQPAFQGRPKHPVIFPKNVFRELGGSSAGTLRDFLNEREGNRQYLDLEDDSLQVDLDTAEEYRGALKKYSPEKSGFP